MGLSVWQIVLVVILFLLLFGRGKIPALMSDLAQGIKSFKTGMRDEPEKDEAHTPVSESVKTAEPAAQTRTTS
ncbi:twin-arginine translocase TatA/TatE family subunit [Marinobacter fonticola]|uniref:twin-arginine translocase TatA/TatE family subunit n=1 Tax=Marinobacter fonticola TaxID=2603215 RepID=UPI0011E640BD|nr:twin-arginine translocase TatA/TatE family subunit [Marinobacter fonticola]